MLKHEEALGGPRLSVYTDGGSHYWHTQTRADTA